jgi:glutamate/tyrosine decarboxylase-like PLP-dependent enzyme
MEGWKPEDKPIAYTSRQSHYSVSRGAMVSGMGMNQMRNVPCERWTGAMSHEALEEMIVKDIEAGNKPFFVNSVA